MGTSPQTHLPLQPQRETAEQAISLEDSFRNMSAIDAVFRSAEIGNRLNNYRRVAFEFIAYSGF